MDQTFGVNENVDTLFHSLENFTQKEGIIGKAVNEGDKTFIPVLSVTVGYGSGNTAGKSQQSTMPSSGSAQGGAIGLGAKLSTDAVIMIDSGNVTMLPVNSGGNMHQIIDKIPQIVSGMNTTKQSQ